MLCRSAPDGGGCLHNSKLVFFPNVILCFYVFCKVEMVLEFRIRYEE